MARHAALCLILSGSSPTLAIKRTLAGTRRVYRAYVVSTDCAATWAIMPPQSINRAASEEPKLSVIRPDAFSKRSIPKNACDV